MKNISINNGSIDRYQPTPNLHYDISGKVMKNDGKDIRIEKSAGSKVIEYEIKLKKNINAKIGEQIEIKKENIQSLKIEKKEEISDEESEEIGKIIENLNMENSEEHQEIIENLIGMGIKPTKENIESYKQSLNSLNKVVSEIDVESIVKLMDKGIDFENLNLLEASEMLEVVKGEEEQFSIKKFLKIDKYLDYKEAEEVAKDIYGQKMGKDVYDVIIALDKENISINKYNIDRAMDVISKVHDLKKVDDEDYVVILKEDMDFSINNLFKVKNEYTTNTLVNNVSANIFEEQTIIEDINFENLKELLENMEIELTDENLLIGREFLINKMNIVKEDFDIIKEMKASMKDLKEKLNNNEIVKFLDNDVNVLEENIDDLLKTIELEVDIDVYKMDIDFEELEFISSIKDKDLLKLIKSGKDFNLTNLKKIIDTDIKNDLSLNFKVLDRSKLLVDVFNKIGDIPNSKAISLSIDENEDTSLNNLYEKTLILDEKRPINTNVESEIENIIVNEYIRARNNISTAIIKESIIDGEDIINMPISKYNKYVDKKINRYREISELTSNMRNISINQEKIIPIIMKNDLSMTLKEINDINSYLLGNKGLSKAIKDATDRGNEMSKYEYKDEIISLQKDISDSIKDDGYIIKEEYKNLLNILDDSSKSFSEDRHKDKDNKDEYIELQNKISKKDTIFQLPIEIDGDFKDLNIIIPDTDKGIDKNNMKFALSLSTKNLGYIDMDLKVSDKDIYININEENNGLNENIDILVKSLEGIGYNLNILEKI